MSTANDTCSSAPAGTTCARCTMGRAKRWRRCSFLKSSSATSTSTLHPALLDMATAGAQPLIEGFDAEQHFYVPFSCGRLVMHAALKPNCVSHITYKATGMLPDIPAFDVTIADESGTPLVTISNFVMKRVHDTPRWPTMPGR